MGWFARVVWGTLKLILDPALFRTWKIPGKILLRGPVLLIKDLDPLLASCMVFDPPSGLVVLIPSVVSPLGVRRVVEDNPVPMKDLGALQTLHPPLAVLGTSLSQSLVPRLPYGLLVTAGSHHPTHRVPSFVASVSPA